MLGADATFMIECCHGRESHVRVCVCPQLIVSAGMNAWGAVLFTQIMDYGLPVTEQSCLLLCYKQIPVFIFILQLQKGVDVQKYVH